MRKIALYISFLILLALACAESSGPSASENALGGAVNIEELTGVATSDIFVYLVEFSGGGMARIDSIHPDFTGKYEFSGFDFGTYGVEASTVYGFLPHHYGFHDGNFDHVFNQSDGISFTYYAHIDAFNVPVYGDIIDTNHYEYEPNDDVSTAQDMGIIHAAHISGNVSSGGFIPPDNYTGDRDLFKFESVWTGYLTVELDWSGYADLDLFLYDGYGITVLEQSTSSGSGPVYVYRSVYRRDEFIVLVASVDDPSDYELSIRIR